jgi:hypothetical protein
MADKPVVAATGLPAKDTIPGISLGRGRGRPRKDPAAPPKVPVRVPMYEELLWREAMLVAMQVLQVRNPAQLNACRAIAEEYILQWRSRFA